MKLIDVLVGERKRFKKLSEEEDSPKDNFNIVLENIKNDIVQGKKVCVLYYEHLMNMNIELGYKFKKNYDNIIKNIEYSQKLYKKKHDEYSDIYEENADEYLVKWEIIYEKIEELYFIQNDMDDIKELMDEFLNKLEKPLYMRLHSRYNNKTIKNEK
jgi:hypothetical protein